MIARSTESGSPRVLPRIIMAQRTSLLSVRNVPLNEVFELGSPSENPTLA